MADLRQSWQLNDRVEAQFGTWREAKGVTETTRCRSPREAVRRGFPWITLRPRSILAAWLVCANWLPSVWAINGLEGTFEFACDAPWRIEPQRLADGTTEYGAIPFQISIHDAMHAGLDNLYVGGPNQVVFLPDVVVGLGEFRSVRIRELGPSRPVPNPTRFELADLFEIEMTAGAWPSGPDEGDRRHSICRRWAGEDPEPFRDLTGTSEWHATLWYTPTDRNRVPGNTLVLEIEVVLARRGWTDRLRESVQLVSGLELGNSIITLRNYVKVHLAADPLPRFNRRWLYGDFHYHAQGTDNEGEAAYNYRGVIRAMGAMGLDFLFATEHASASDQVIDLDLSIDLLEEYLGSLGGDVDSLEESDAEQRWGVRRDMDGRRYAFCHGLIYGDNGANRQASLQGSAERFPQNYLSYGVVPQVFLGGELDAIPELSLASVGPPPPPEPGKPPFATWTKEYWEWTQAKKAHEAWHPYWITYGNGLVYNLAKLRGPGKAPLAKLYEATSDAVLVRDFQGLDTYDLYGREHLVYFPDSSRLIVSSKYVATADLPGFCQQHPDKCQELEGSESPGSTATGQWIYESSFIPSYTSRFGGATRRLDASHKSRPPLLPEIASKGVAFLAHHLNAGEGNRGPEGVPWTRDHMLLIAFRSPAILGLEFWNEDARFQSRLCSHGYCRDDGFLGEERGFERDEVFDFLGYQPAELTDVPLALPEVREGFISGGLSGSLFELKPFSVPDGRWERPSRAVEHALHHGAYDWDRLNLLGLDFEDPTRPAWLPPGTPRRVFMGGGSDAHGDLSFRRAGYFLGAEDANDTAIGKPRNLVLAGDPEGPVLADLNPLIDPGVRLTASAASPAVRPPRPIDPPIVGGVIRAHTQEQIIRALRAGRFSVTDGPALRIALDMNSNNRIDDTDIQMGDVYPFKKRFSPNPAENQLVTVLVECFSTPEFGPITKLDLYVGVHPTKRGEGIRPRVYAPADHAVRDSDSAHSSNPQFTYISHGTAYSQMEDGYWLDPRLTTAAPSGSPLLFTWAITLDLDHYEVGKGVTADRFFVRAFAQTGVDVVAQQPSRYAFTNPIWLLRDEFNPSDLPAVVTPVFRLASQPTVTVERAADGLLQIEFIGKLQHAARLGEPFVDLPGAVSPHPVPPREAAGFYRARE